MSRSFDATDRTSTLRAEFLQGVRETLLAWQRGTVTDLQPPQRIYDEAERARRDGAQLALAWLGIERAIEPWLERYSVTRWQFFRTLQAPNV